MLKFDGEWSDNCYIEGCTLKYQNGIVKKEGDWNMSVKGFGKAFYENSVLMWEGYVMNGKKQGKGVQYDEQGIKQASGIWDKDFKDIIHILFLVSTLLVFCNHIFSYPIDGGDLIIILLIVRTFNYVFLKVGTVALEF